MVLELYTPNAQDLPEIVQLGYDGYADDPVTALMYPVPVSKEQLAQSLESTIAGYGKDPNHTHLTVKDTETGRIVSWMEWDLVPKPTDEHWNTPRTNQTPPGWNGDFFQKAAAKAWQSKRDAMGRQSYIYLQTLVTPPQYRQRGAGSLLMKALLDFQAQVNLPIYLISSPSGATLYPKFGFKEILRYELDISALGTNEQRFHIGMLLPAPRPSLPAHLPRSLAAETPITTNEVTIRPLESISEHLAMRGIRDRAFGPSELISLTFGGQSANTTPETLAGNSYRDAIKTPRHRWLGAFDNGTDTLLGVAHWYFVDDLSIEHHPHGSRGWAPGTNVELAEAHFGSFERLRTSVMKDKKFAYMCLLLVDPAAQRRGIGGKLLKHTLSEVDDLDWESWIEALPDGLELYRRFGWEVVEWVETDLKPWGGSEVARDAVMLRPSRSARSSRGA